MAAPNPFPELSGRQARVAHLAALGNTNGQIAKKLSIKETTVGTHIARALKRLGLKRKSELTQLMIKRMNES